MEAEKLQKQDQKAARRAQDISEDCFPFVGPLKGETKGEADGITEAEQLEQETDAPEFSPTMPITVHHLTTT